MANNFTSNFSTKLMRIFMEKYESARVLSKNVNTQLLEGKFNPASGTQVDFKRPTDYTATETSDGDIGSTDPKDIIVGKAFGTVQNYITVHMDFDEVDQALKMDQLDELLAPAAQRIVTTLELNMGVFMAKNTALIAGTLGNSVNTWGEVAEAGAVLTANGIPATKPWYYTVNPFSQIALAENQRSLGAGGSAGAMITEAHHKATIVNAYAGFDRVMTATTLPSYTTDSEADRAGTLTAAPTLTYVGAKDTMTQTLAVTAFGANLEVRAGETLTIAGRYRVNLATRKVILDADGNKILWSATVTTAVTLGSSGEGSIVVTGPAIWETAGAYNTTEAAVANGDVVTLLGAASTTYQPNLFWQKDAFAIGSVPIKKLFSTDTTATTKDGMQLRVSKYADGDGNAQTIRFDLHPAFAVLNPFFAGKGFGKA
jgi:hypothetical protein